MSVDLLIKNGLLVTPTCTYPAGIAVDYGKIVAVGNEKELPVARRSLDVGGYYIMPGAVDGHVHFRDPGQNEKEDFKTGSSAAAMGGITTVVDMPNTGKLVRGALDVQEKRKIVELKSCVDFGLFGAITDDLAEIERMAEAGVLGYKVFLGYKEWKGLPMAPTNDGLLYQAMKTAATTGLRVSFHAENVDLIDQLIAEMRKTGRDDLWAFLEARPPMVETEVVFKICLLARETRCKINICHISAGETVDILQYVGADIDVVGETGPHYLFFTAEDYDRLGNVVKVTPPIRTKLDQDKLWEGIQNGIIKTIATDHAPHCKEEKETSNIWDCASGFPGVETMIPVMLTLVNRGRITLNKLVELVSVNPAIAWGLYPQKGSFAPGSDADFTIVDLNKEWIFKANQGKSKSKVSPYDGMQMRGKVLYSVLRGNIIVDKGELIDDHFGQMIILRK